MDIEESEKEARVDIYIYRKKEAVSGCEERRQVTKSFWKKNNSKEEDEG